MDARFRRGAVPGALACLLAAVAQGCATIPKHPMTLTNEDAIIFVQGTSGPVRWGDRQLAEAMDRTACPARLVAHQWHKSRPPCYVVCNEKEYALVQAAAADLREIVMDLRRRHPDAEVHVAAQSAGCEVTRLALAGFEDGVMVDSVLMVAPSISPEVPLGDALGHVRGTLAYTTSSVDVLMWAGTALLCTTDQKKCSAAGYSGFRPPKDSPDEVVALYREKLRRIRWKPEYIRYGWTGDHVSGWSPDFAASFAIPFFCGHVSGEDVPTDASPTPRGQCKEVTQWVHDEP